MAGRLGAQGASGAMMGFFEAGMRYGDDASSTELWRRRREKQRRRKEKNGDVTSFKGRPGSKRKPRRGLLHASATPKTATTTRGSRKKIAGGDSCSLVLFILFTKLPFDLKTKLLPNLYNNSKISKNKSCSKFKVLQLCFYN